nr:hypothetical protein [Deltaproteobacteria bacterium]
MSKRTIAYLVITILSALLLYACVGAGKKQYDIGMQLSNEGKYKDAIAYLNQAIEKEPSNKEYQKALTDMKEKIVNQFVSQGSQVLSSQSPATMAVISKAKTELGKAQEIDATHPAVKDFANKLGNQEMSLLSEVKGLYEKAKEDVAAERWLEAYFNLQQVQSRFPNYEDSFQLLAKVSSQGSGAFYTQAKSLFYREDFKGAVNYLRKALSVKGDHRPSRELLNLAQERDNKDYFIEQANQARIAHKWDRAVNLYKRALEYDPRDQDLRQLIVYVREQAGQFNIRKAKDVMDEGLLLKAFDTYELAAKNIQDQNDYQLNNLRRDLAARAKYTAGQFKDQGQFGAAWFWYNKIKSIDPDFPDIFFLTQEMEDNIKGRVQKSIAVFDFGSPSYSEDAGGRIANNLITFLFKNAS